MNRIYIIPTVDRRLELTLLKDRFANYFEYQVDINTRDDVKGNKELFELIEAVDIGEEAEFRFYKQNWTSDFIGKVLSYGSRHYDDKYLKDIFNHNLQAGYVIQITGGPDSLKNPIEKDIYFGLIRIVSELYSGMIFIDPEGSVNNNDYYNRLEKRLYSSSDFQNYLNELSFESV